MTTHHATHTRWFLLCLLWLTGCNTYNALKYDRERQCFEPEPFGVALGPCNNVESYIYDENGDIWLVPFDCGDLDGYRPVPIEETPSSTESCE